MANDLPSEVEITKTHDLEEINYIMNNLENGRVYDITGTPSDGYIATEIKNLREYLNELSYIIQRGKLGVEEPKKLFYSYDEIKK